VRDSARGFGIASLVLGVLALLARLAYEASCVDLGADLGIDGRGFQIAFHLGSLALSLAGASGAILALVFGRTTAERFGLPLPGLAVSAMVWVMAIVL
jgi:hypothetical protein